MSRKQLHAQPRRERDGKPYVLIRRGDQFTFRTTVTEALALADALVDAVEILEQHDPAGPATDPAPHREERA